jgi:sacsin
MDAGTDADADGWSDFGQKVDLTARLREILLNYPEGTSILKELVQNAVRARPGAHVQSLLRECRLI